MCKENVNIYKVKLVKEEVEGYGAKISSPTDASKVVKKFIEDKNDRECFVVVCLSTKNTITGINLVSMGGINSTIVTRANVFKPAILSNSDSIIVAHNHPSGDISPSEEDLGTTKRLKEAGEILGIEVLDHLIIGEGDAYTSLKSKGDM